MDSKISAIFSIPATDWESEVKNSEGTEVWESCHYFELYLSSKTYI